MDLGVTVDSKLNFTKHVQKIVKKANRVLGLIKRSIGYKAPLSVKKQLYVSLVRSNLEYCVPAWAGLNKKNTIAIERVQRAATRYILGYPDKSYKDRLNLLKLLPLSYRRELFDVNFLFRCVNHLYDLDVSGYVNFTHNNIVNTRNTSDITMLCIPTCKTSAFKKSYFNRIVNIWNTIPTSLRCVNDFIYFKRHLLYFYIQFYYKDYDPERSCTWSVA